MGLHTDRGRHDGEKIALRAIKTSGVSPHAQLNCSLGEAADFFSRAEEFFSAEQRKTAEFLPLHFPCSLAGKARGQLLRQRGDRGRRASL
jgi:hypothetical protein